MKVLYNREIDLAEWNDIVSSSLHSTPFQTHEFYELVNGVEGLSAQAIAVSESGIIKALAVITYLKEKGIIGYFSKRAIIFGGVLIRDGENSALELLLHEIEIASTHDAIYIETRNLSDYGGFQSTFLKLKWNYINYLNFRVATMNKEKMIKSMSSSRYRQVKKAQKANVNWKEAENVEQIRAFYLILKGLYDKKVKKPLLPWEFFKKSYEKGFGKFLLIHYREKVIGGIMCPLQEKKALYEFYICGSDYEYREQYPSIMATWAALEYANQNGIAMFDFMGAGQPHRDYGVREFKEKFGGELVEYGRFARIISPMRYQIGKSGLRLKRILN